MTQVSITVELKDGRLLTVPVPGRSSDQAWTKGHAWALDFVDQGIPWDAIASVRLSEFSGTDEVAHQTIARARKKDRP